MKVHHLSISVRSLEESIKFYTEVFNFVAGEPFERKEMQARAVFLELDGFFLELWELQQHKPGPADMADLHVVGLKHLAFEVEDIEKLYLELQERKIICSKPQEGATGTYLFLTDPNGIALELHQP